MGIMVHALLWVMQDLGFKVYSLLWVMQAEYTNLKDEMNPKRVSGS